MAGTWLPRNWRLSPNVELRFVGEKPDILLLHYTGMRSAERACDWLCNPESKVSCHYLVDETGGITQMVDEDLRAWHAGVSSWEGNTDVNSRSIGIEIHNPGHADGYPDFPSAQMASVVALSRDIIARHNINDRRVLGHSDVAPGRKVDPGEKFDWRHLHAQGVGHWVQPAPIRPGPVVCRGDTGHDVTTLQAQLRQYGYGLEVSGTYDRATATVVAAFQRHFRPALVDGVADLSTRETLLRLLDE